MKIGKLELKHVVYSQKSLESKGNMFPLKLKNLQAQQEQSL